MEGLTGNNYSLSGKSESVLYVQTLDSVTPQSPCKNAKPQVNGDVLLPPLKVPLGELYELTFPVNLFTDEVSTNLPCSSPD